MNPPVSCFSRNNRCFHLNSRIRTPVRSECILQYSRLLTDSSHIYMLIYKEGQHTVRTILIHLVAGFCSRKAKLCVIGKLPVFGYNLPMSIGTIRSGDISNDMMGIALESLCLFLVLSFFYFNPLLLKMQFLPQNIFADTKIQLILESK